VRMAGRLEAGIPAKQLSISMPWSINISPSLSAAAHHDQPQGQALAPTGIATKESYEPQTTGQLRNAPGSHRRHFLCFNGVSSWGTSSSGANGVRFRSSCFHCSSFRSRCGSQRAARARSKFGNPSPRQ
jgi:hypothetical protein